MYKTQFEARNSGIDYAAEFGLNLNKLGCVMLDLDLEIMHTGAIEKLVKGLDAEVYVSDDPDMPWIKGITKPHDTHITIRYGLLPGVRMSHCKEVMPIFPWSRETYLMGTLEAFPGYTDDYYVLVLNIDDPISSPIVDYVRKAYDALGVLPNLSTFSPPTFHVTLAYLQGDINMVANFNRRMKYAVWSGGIRYGRNMRP